MNILMFYEEVLMAPSERPILNGFLLAHTLVAQNRLLIATSGTEEKINHQLRTERLQGQIAEIIDNSVDLPKVPLWRRQIEIARSRGGLDMVITPDPLVMQWLLEQNVLGMLFSHPVHVGKARRPQQGNRSWDELIEEMEARP